MSNNTLVINLELTKLYEIGLELVLNQTLNNELVVKIPIQLEIYS